MTRTGVGEDTTSLILVLLKGSFLKFLSYDRSWLRNFVGGGDERMAVISSCRRRRIEFGKYWIYGTLGAVFGAINWIYADEIGRLFAEATWLPAPVNSNSIRSELYQAGPLIVWAAASAVIVCLVSWHSMNVFTVMINVTLFIFMANVFYYGIYVVDVVTAFGDETTEIVTNEGLFAWWTSVERVRVVEMVVPDFIQWTGLGLCLGMIGGLLGGYLTVAFLSMLGHQAHK